MAGEPHPAWLSGVSTGEQICRFRVGFTRFTADSPLSIPQSAKLRRVTKVDENSSQGHRQDQVLVASQRPPSTPRCPSSRRHKWLQCRDTGRSVTGHQRASSANFGHSCVKTFTAGTAGVKVERPKRAVAGAASDLQSSPSETARRGPRYGRRTATIRPSVI